jgi:hypothetical protein
MEIDIFSYRVRVERDLIVRESANVGDLESGSGLENGWKWDQ